MATQVEIAILVSTVSAENFSAAGADFDTQAVDDAVLAKLNQLLPIGVFVLRNGEAFADRMWPRPPAESP